MTALLPYILILISDFLFASQFLITGIYSRRNKRGVIASLAFSAGTNFSAVFYMLFVNKFAIEFSVFTLAISFIYAVVIILSVYCSNAALNFVNLSVYSLFNMLGSVVLSALFGFLVFAEKITLGTGICIVFVLAALALGAEYKGGARGAAKFYISCFFLNGITGTLVKIHQEPFEFVSGVARVGNRIFGLEVSLNPEKFSALSTSNNNFFFFSSLLSLILSLILLGVFAVFRKENTFRAFANGRNLACMGGYGVVHGVAQLLSLYTLSVLPLSLQQPLVTGGVIAFTFVISLVFGEKQKRKDVAAFILAIVSLLAILIDYI